MSIKWSSNEALEVYTEDLVDIYSNLDEYSDISFDQKNIANDWHFPLINLCESDHWMLFEDDVSFNKPSISEICCTLKNKLLCEFQAEILLQHPIIILKLIKWLNENKEPDLILECLHCLTEKLIKRYYEYTTGLCEYFETVVPSSDSNSQTTAMDINSEITAIDENSHWGIARYCVSVMPCLLKHINYNSDSAFSFFMSNIRLLLLISDSCNAKFYFELVFSNFTSKNITINEPLTSLKYLIIAKELFTHCLSFENFKELISNIIKQPYWIHLYPELYYELSEHIINEELLELKIVKMVENAYNLSTSNLNFKQNVQLFKTSLPILWFHQQFNIIDKFIMDACKHTKLPKAKNENEYETILLNLLSYKSSDVVLYTYSTLNKIVKKTLNNLNFESNEIDRLIEYFLCTNVLNEIICFGCVNSSKQICQLASEIVEHILNSKDRIKNYEWKHILKNIAPVFPVLCCYADQESSFGQIIFSFFDPDQAKNLNISKLELLHSIILMMMSKNDKSRVEANNRITWLLKTNLDKYVDLPVDVFIIEFDDLNEKIEDPIGEYNTNDLDDMIDLISNHFSSHQTIKCALYKISVMLEYNHLQQYFIQSGGIDIVLNLFKTSKLFQNERGLLIALLKLVLCFAKKKYIFFNESNLLANNFEIQLHLISVLSDFYDVPLVKNYILQILVYCIFDQYLTSFCEIPKVVIDKICIPFKIEKLWNSNKKYDDALLFFKIQENKNCMDTLVLNWHLKHFDNIELFLENGLTKKSFNAYDHLFNDVYNNFKKSCIKWSVKKYLNDLIAVKSHPVALAVLSDLKRCLELSTHVKQFEIDEKLLEKALKKFLILPPIFLSDLQTLIVVLKLLNFALKKKVLINKLNWIVEALLKSESMHHNIRDNFKNDDKSKQLCNQFFFELYEVYWLCLKNYGHFSTLNRTKLLFNQLSSMKNEYVLLQVVMKCLTLLTENPKNINEEIVKTCLFQFNSLKMALMNSLNKNSLQRNYLIILNHVFHHSVLLPKICEVWRVNDWETWTWSMIHSTDPLIRALVFQFSAGLTVIDIPVSRNLINFALNSFCEPNRLGNCVVAEHATVFCSNIFCNVKFKSLCQQYLFKLDFNIFVRIINLCSYYDSTKFEKKCFSTSPKLVANICCMLFNMITLSELDLSVLDQTNQFVHALIICLKKYLTPECIEKPNVMEMCGRICSILTLFLPVTDYDLENLLNSLNLIYERTNINLDHCTTMVWRSSFKLLTMVQQCTNHTTLNVTNNLITALLTSITSKNNDLCVDALNVIFAMSSRLSEKFAHRVCKIVISTLFSEWHHKLKRKMLLSTLSSIFFEHPSTYEIARKDNFLCFIISKLKIVHQEILKQSTKISKIIQNDFLEIVGFCCNVFNGCIHARKDASAELPDIIHKLWPIITVNPKSDMLIYAIRMLISLTSNCPIACSAITMTTSTFGVDPKIRNTSYSLFHEIVSLTSICNLHEDTLYLTLLLILNCCQAQECRSIITKSKLLTNISIFDPNNKKHSKKIEEQWLKFLLIFTNYNEGQIYTLKVDHILDTLVSLLQSNYKSYSIAILRNLCFNTQNRVTLLSSDIFLSGVKTMLEKKDLTNLQYKDISLAIWAVACNNQKARVQLRHWGIDKYFEKPCNLLICDNETRNILNFTYQVLKS